MNDLLNVIWQFVIGAIAMYIWWFVLCVLMIMVAILERRKASND